MADTLPDDWEAQVSRAYATFGIDLADGADEFAFRGFPRLSVDFLRRKAEQQLRDRLGRWREERGSIDAFQKDRPNPQPFDKSWEGRGASIARSVDSVFQKTPQQNPGIVEIPQKDAARTLWRAGWTKDRAKRWADRGRVFRYSDDGKNAIYVFVADPEETINSRIEPYVKRLERTVEKKRVADERLAAAIRTNSPSIKTLQWKADVLERDLTSFTQHLSEAKERWGRVHNLTPENTSEEFTQRLVNDAGRVLRDTFDKAPEWKKKSTRSLMVEFDESVMIADQTERKIVPAQSKRGGNVISMDRSQYFEATDILPDDWSMPVGAKYFGEYSIPHEIGHLADELDTNAYWSSMEHRDVWIKAIQDGLMSTYGRGNPREGYAEAFAMWLHDPDSPVAKMYAERFQWEKSERIRPGVDDVVVDDDYWESILAQEPPPDIVDVAEESPDLVETVEETGTDPFAAATPRRLVGAEAARALHSAGYNANEAALYANTGEVFTRDGKVFSFHPYPTAAPMTRRARELRDEVRALKRNPRTHEPYQRLPAGIKAQVQVLERQIRALEKQIETFPLKPKKLKAQDVRYAKIALRDMEAGLKKLPKWRDKSEPFMVEIDPDLMVADITRPMTLGQAVVGSNKIALNPQVYSVERQAFSELKDPRSVVFHELGHVTDARPYEEGSSRSAGGMMVFSIAKTLQGMTTYGAGATQEGYAEMFAKWASGDRDSPAVQFYARAFGWSASVRRNPTPASVKALAKRMGIEIPRGEQDMSRTPRRSRAPSTRVPGSGWSRN